MDRRRGERKPFITDLTADMIFIKGNVISYPQLPLGGIKRSGLGQKIFTQGIRELCNIRAVWAARPTQG